ncbi:YkyB family protein [Scopulibacillus cellulosilyticus]|uniref:YkyB family protein n=1 Tax=Scopulibacillus cellulosilyticus TaxID=2665665 RepID=A0ABW2PXF4_9BACL
MPPTRQDFKTLHHLSITTDRKNPKVKLSLKLAKTIL